MAKKEETIIEIKPIEMKTTTIRIVGDTPLIVHKWSEKARRELIKETPLLTKRVPRNMYAEAASTLWWMDDNANPFGRCESDDEFSNWVEKYKAYCFDDFARDTSGQRFGFPATGIKGCAINATYREGYSKSKVILRSAFFIDGFGEDQLVEIKHDGIPSVREDNCKVGMGTADLRYRPQFENWWADLTIRYNANGNYSISDIVNMINLGGQTNGIGEWRIEKGGQYGIFHVE